MPDSASQRFNMVVSQALANGVSDERILGALRRIERERFVPAAKRAVAYADLAIEIVHGRFLLDPRTFALLLDAAGIKSTDKVLDIACGTGYSTAVISCLADSVIGLDNDVDLVRIAADSIALAAHRGASIVHGVLAEGHRPAAPFDVIFINGAIETVPVALLGQLAEGGRLVAVVMQESQGHATVFLNEHGHVGRRIVFDATVPKLAGFRQPAGFVF